MNRRALSPPSGRACGTSRKATRSSASPRATAGPAGIAGRATTTIANTPSPPAATGRTTYGRGPSPSTCRTTESCLFRKPPGIVLRRGGAHRAAVGRLERRHPLQPNGLGDDVVVIGVGGIGMLCLMVARGGRGRQADGRSTRALTPARTPCRWARRTRWIRPAATPSSGCMRFCRRGPDLVVEAAGTHLRRQADGRTCAAEGRNGTSSALPRTRRLNWTADGRTSSKGAWTPASAPLRWPCRRRSG